MINAFEKKCEFFTLRFDFRKLQFRYSDYQQI